jgi:hypothetical protein
MLILCFMRDDDLQPGEVALYVGITPYALQFFKFRGLFFAFKLTLRTVGI